MRTKAILLIIVLLFSYTSVLIQANEASANVSVNQENLDRYTEVLSSLNLKVGIAGNPSDVVTRVEFAGLLMQLNNTGVVNDPSEFYYRDVDDKTPSFREIYTASDFGLMRGTNGLFKPGSPLTVADVQMAYVAISGSNVNLPQQNDLYFSTKASSLGLMKGLTATTGNVTRGMLAVMTHNLLNIDFMSATGLIDTSNRYRSYGNFMEQKLEVKKVTGLVTKTEASGLYSVQASGLGRIEIDGTIYNCAVNAVDFLGCKVTVYIDFSGSIEKIIHIEKHRDNDEIFLTPSKIAADSSGNVISYYDEGGTKAKTLNYNPNAIVIYNTKYAGTVKNFTAGELSLKNAAGENLSGDMMLIDNDGDMIYDVIILNIYETLWIENANAKLLLYSDKYGNTIDLNDFGKYTIYDGSNETDASAIMFKSTLSIAKSFDGNNVIIKVSNDAFDGVLEEVADGKFKLDGEWYEPNSYFTHYSQIGARPAYKLGVKSTYYLDIYGNIAEKDEATEEYKFGYAMALSSLNSLSQNLKMKMFTSEANFETFSISENLNINDKRYSAGTINTSPLFNGGAFKHQLIKYKLNEAGEISMIMTADDSHCYYDINAVGHDWYYPEEFTLNFKGLVRYSMYDTGILGAKYHFKDIIWVIPEDMSDEKMFDIKRHLLVFKNAEIYNTEIYNVNKYGAAGLVIYRATVSSDSYTQGPAIVKNVTSVVNDSAEVTKRLYLLENGLNITFDLAPDGTFPELNTGDIIRYNTDSSGNIRNFKFEFQYTKDADFFTPITETNLNQGGVENTLIYGQVVAMDKNATIIQFRSGKVYDSDTNTWVQSPTRAFIYNYYSPVYVFDVKEKTVTVGNFNDILTVMSHGEEYASKVLIDANYLTARGFTIYKED